MIDWVYDPADRGRRSPPTSSTSRRSRAPRRRSPPNADPEVAALADNPLIFPDDATLAKAPHLQAASTEEEETYLNDEFSKVTGN